MGSISVPAGELAALREEARMAHKWAKEVRRLEEQLLAGKAAAKAARGAPLAPQQQQQRGVHLLPQAGGGAALRAVERADYEQRLGEHKQENARLREQLDRYKKKLVGMHKAAWEGAENPSASPHAGVPGHTPAPAQGGGGAAARAAVPLRPRPEGGGTSAALELAQEREHAARRDWLQAAKPHVRFDEAGGDGRRAGGDPRGRRSVGTQVSAMAGDGDGDDEDGDMRHDEREREKIIAGLKAELLRQNARVAQLLEQVSSLQGFVERVNADKAQVEGALRQTDMKLKDCLKDLDQAAMDKARLVQDLRMARLDKQAMEQREAEIGELREDIETLEKENMDLTYQSLEAIWRGSIVSSAAPPTQRSAPSSDPHARDAGDAGGFDQGRRLEAGQQGSVQGGGEGAGGVALSGGDRGAGGVASAESQHGGKGKMVQLPPAPTQTQERESMMEAKGRIVAAMRAKFSSSGKPQQVLFAAARVVRLRASLCAAVSCRTHALFSLSRARALSPSLLPSLCLSLSLSLPPSLPPSLTHTLPSGAVQLARQAALERNEQRSARTLNCNPLECSAYQRTHSRI